MNISDFVVVTLYPNGEMGRDADGIWFRSVSPVVFQMQPVNTLEELKCVILRNMGAAGAMSVRRVAYRLWNLFPPNQFKFKIFWVDSDEHVRAMFELHRRYGSREVMELLTEMETVNVDAAGPSSSSRGGPEVEREGFGGGGEDYDLDGGSEFQIGHRFSTERPCIWL
ncbi:hypothetical protein PIB30_015003 [Stylosanthes scabra]|uniref:Uncharacterized protein n=1 Tax=Stylosanthes scabra TaxID=79078 RepID=A0ABU6Y6C4_9FABA|nr:hypothetical protein [Stylosanthes scabra]